MGGFIGTAWMKAATPTNITSVFRSTRIWHFDVYVYSDTDLASSLPTEQAAPQPGNHNVFHQDGVNPTKAYA